MAVRVPQIVRVSQIAEQSGEPGPATSASALHGTHGDAEDDRGVGDGVALHVHEDDRGPLIDREPGERGVYVERRIGVDVRPGQLDLGKFDGRSGLPPADAV